MCYVFYVDGIQEFFYVVKLLRFKNVFNDADIARYN